MSGWLNGVIERLRRVLPGRHVPGPDCTGDRRPPSRYQDDHHAAVPVDEAHDTVDEERLRWLTHRRVVAGRPSYLDWRDRGSAPCLDEHLRQDIGLRDTRPGRQPAPWD